MKKAFVLLFVLLAVGCGGKSTTAPTIQPANITDGKDRSLQRSCYGSYCSFTGEGRNTGAGCASNVRGVTRLYDKDDKVLARGDWTYTSRVKPNESFIYSGSFTLSAGTISYYKTDFAWDNVSCGY